MISSKCLVEIAETIIRDILAARHIKDELLVKELIRASGLNSNELFLILAFCYQELKKESPLEQIQACLNERYKVVFDEHNKFQANHITTEEKKRNLTRAVSYLDLDLEAPADLLLGYDKKLMYYENNKLYSLFPVAKKVLSIHIQGKFNAVETLTSDYLQHKIGGEGYVVEFYILQSMKMTCNDGRLLALKWKHIKSKETGNKIFAIREVSEFVTLPSRKPTQTTLYIPLSKQYPDIDCLIYDKDEDKLYPIQITLTQKNHKDSYHSWKEKNEKNWLQVFKNSQVCFIWLVGSSKKFTRKNQNYWAVLFASLPNENQHYFQVFRTKEKELQAHVQAREEIVAEVEESGEGQPEDEEETLV